MFNDFEVAPLLGLFAVAALRDDGSESIMGLGYDGLRVLLKKLHHVGIGFLR